MWSQLAVTKLPGSNPEIDALVAALQMIYGNGDVVFARFQIANHPVLDYFASRGQFKEIEFIPHFLAIPAVVESLPSLKLASHFARQKMFSEEMTLTLGGQLAHSLAVWGSAYHKHSEGPAHAKQIGLGFCRGLFQERYSDVVAFNCVEPWSDFFCAVAWDLTWFIVDRRERTVALLCGTDTD